MKEIKKSFKKCFKNLKLMTTHFPWIKDKHPNHLDKQKDQMNSLIFLNSNKLQINKLFRL